jgi:hypothetical protein
MTETCTPADTKQTECTSASAEQTELDTGDTIVCIRWDAAVREGKQIIERSVRDQLRLGEIADKVETRYGENTLEKLAVAIGVAPCTLERHRSVYRAYKDTKPAPGPVSYSVLRALQDHPDRVELIQANPKMTQSEARKLARPYKENKDSDEPAKGKQDENEWDQHNRRWFKNLYNLAEEVGEAANVFLDCTPEKQRQLLKAVDSRLVMYLRGNGSRLVQLANDLEALLDEAANTTEAQELQAA